MLARQAVLLRSKLHIGEESVGGLVEGDGAPAQRPRSRQVCVDVSPVLTASRDEQLPRRRPIGRQTQGDLGPLGQQVYRTRSGRDRKRGCGIAPRHRLHRPAEVIVVATTAERHGEYQRTL